MNQRLALLALPLLMWSHAASAKCEIRDASAFATEFAVAFHTNSIAALDKKYCLLEPLRVVITHSIAEDQREETTVRTYSELGAWLLKQRRDKDIPYPALWPFQGCESGVCGFGGGNQMHSTLFLTEVRYKWELYR